MAAILVVACGSPVPSAPATAPQAAPSTAADVPAELRGLIEDVTAATAHRYGATDDAGHVMDTAKVIQVPGPGAFAAVYHAWSEADGAFHVHLATSDNLLDWTWRRELARLASQPTIAPTSDGGYVVAWEQEPDPIHLSIVLYASWGDLLAGRVARRIDPPVTTPACGEGTPSIEAASSTRVDLAFHYHAGCDLDREAGGSTDWTTWQAATRPAVDRALANAGVTGHMGDRDRITYRGHDLTLIEGQLLAEDVRTWRTFLYDARTGEAQALHFRTHAGSAAFSNPTITQVEIDGREAIVVTLYVISEAAAAGEDGELIYYRMMPDTPGS
jgi:hypothetical protein